MGEVVSETTKLIATVVLYPGYLAWPVKTDVTGWKKIFGNQQE